MNILRELAEATRAKNQKVVMKRERFATQDKTKKCGRCGKPGTTIHFGKETRILCTFHIKQLNAKHEKHVVSSSTFKRASSL